jgi:uncharacterized protein DUF3592
MTDARKWNPPKELARIRPRPVRLTAAGQTVFIAMAFLVASAIPAGVWLSRAAIRNQARLASRLAGSVATDARVTELTRTHGENRRHIIVYSYEVNGQIHPGRASVRRQDWSPLKVGAVIRVQYLRKDPTDSWMPGYERKGVPLFVAPLAVCALLISAAAIGYALRRQWCLLSEGRPALARVTDSKPIKNSHGSSGYRIRYEFKILSGATRRGSVDKSGKPGSIGDTLIIVYDPETPERSAVYPLSLVKVGDFRF